ncbi:hypothetical protein D3C81_1317660 [compost metagenome]
MAQQVGAHHRCQRQRDNQRQPDRHRQGDGELAEQAARQAFHQQQRNKHCHQRHAHRQHGEAHFTHPDQRRINGFHAGLDVAGNILQHHDSVVDHEAGSDGQCHQRQVIQTEAAQIHGGEGADQRDRHRYRRDQRSAAGTQEDEHHQDHQPNGDHQRLLYFCQ